MSTEIDLNQPRITFTGVNSYSDALNALDSIELELNDGANYTLIGATHTAELSVMRTTLGARYLVEHRELHEMTHAPDDIGSASGAWLSVDVFIDLTAAKQYYAELILSGVQAWVDSFGKE